MQKNKLSIVLLALTLTACQNSNGFVKARVSDILPITDKEKKLKSVEFILINNDNKEIKGDIKIDLVKFSSVYDSKNNEDTNKDASIISKTENAHIFSTENIGVPSRNFSYDSVYSSLINNTVFLYGVRLDGSTPPPGVYVIKLKTAFEEIRTFPLIYSTNGHWYVRTLEDDKNQEPQKNEKSTTGTTTKPKPSSKIVSQ